MLAGLTGTLLAVWWWRSRPAAGDAGDGDRGVVIYRNTPSASDQPAL
jgi:hypothetical protein